MTAAFPLFVIAGMPRSGTTFLHHHLGRHSSVFSPVRKEVNYFSTSHHHGPIWLADQYRNRKSEQIGIDASPFYFLDSRSIDWMLEFDPNIKVILGVRQPSEWLCSLYEQLLNIGRDLPPFPVWSRGYRWREGIEVVFPDLDVTARIEEFRRAFGQNLLVYDYALLARDAPGLLQSIERFLGLEPHFQPGNFDDRVINAGFRRNVRWMSRFFSDQRVVDMLIRVVPGSILHRVRRASLRLGHPRSAGDNVLRTRNLPFARALLGEQDVRVARLFEKSPLLRGSGDALAPVDGNEEPG